MKRGISEFAKETERSKVVCFGASVGINYMLSIYPEHRLAKRIIAVADNDESKHGTALRTWFGNFPIISVSTLIEMHQQDETLSLLITATSCDEVYIQLDEITELDEMQCYIYALFPYYDHFSELPKELKRLRDGNRQIPKVIHYCWFGGKALPEKDRQNIENWQQLLPDYEIKLWNEDSYDVYKHPFMKDAYKKGAYGFVPDYARLDIVYQHGGLYFDTDVEIIKRPDDLLFSESFFGLVLHSAINAGHGFGARKQSSLLKDMRDIYDGVMYKNDNETYSASAHLETLALSKRGYYGGNRFLITPETVIYPVEFFSPKSSIFGIPKVSDNCYSIHNFNYSWASSTLREKKLKQQEYFRNLVREDV